MNISTILAICIGGLLAGYAFFMCSVRLIAILQQQGYSGRAFLKWYYRSRNIERKKASLLALAVALLTALFCVCFSFAGYRIANLVCVLPFAGICILYCAAEQRHALKVPLKNTMRAVRLGVAYAVLLCAADIGLGFALAAIADAAATDWVYLLRFVPFCLVPLVCPLLLVFVNLCMKAYEVPHTNKFVRRAAAALAASPCVKVGITGSFGKTSVKNFAAVMLSEKYRVLATPASYNTPVGIAKAVNEGGLDCDVFLAEMGARRKGDIAALCDLVRPTAGVVTGVTCQHVQTFGSLDAIRAEKGELARRVPACVLGRSAADMGGGKSLVMGRDFDAEDVQLSLDGTRFTLRLPDGRVPVEIPVLGRHAAEDAALAAALCHTLGMTAEEIAAGIRRVAPVPHRLERKDANGLIILDDGYNCNPEGAKNAVEVLRLAKGRKAVVTPGIVELGQLEEKVNMELGASLVGLDLVLLVGETLVLDVRNGYLEAGGDAEKLRIVPTLEAAQTALAEELAAGDCVLFLNDLPDCY